MMEFQWELKDGNWLLLPSSISVIETDWCWVIYVSDRPMTGRYTSAQGARLDAWQYAYSKRRALFGSYRIRLNTTAHGEA
jgi:hypothetical protein